MTNLSGVRLGPYEVLEPIGAGAMGEVRRARHVQLQRDVAIEVMPAGLVDDRGQLSGFLREARAAAQLDHPNIVRIYDVGEQDGAAYVATEIVEGRTLGAFLAEAPLAIDAALRLAVQIAAALAAAHAAGSIHRHLNPANVMVTERGQVKLLGFGMAKPVSTVEPLRRSDRTAPGSLLRGPIVGAPHYLAPEQLTGAAVDHRADQFAFGALLFAMLAGEPPFDGTTLSGLICAILMDRTPSLLQLRTGIPPALEWIVAQCLEKNRALRFASTAELRAALQRLAARRARVK